MDSRNCQDIWDVYGLDQTTEINHTGSGGVVDCNERKSEKGVVISPFTVVKSGEVSLDDINKALVRPSGRSLRHPVGQFGARRCIQERGFSGEAVVAVTTIHTQGQGSITVIRTKR